MDKSILKKIANYCVYQERCHKEVVQKLAEWKIYGDQAQEFLSWLITENYLNEERFAKHYASSKFRVKKWGLQKIRFELKGKGISANCLKIALNEISKEAYEETIIQLVEKKHKEIKESNALIKKQKVLNYLVSKGFETSEVLPHLLFFIFIMPKHFTVIHLVF